MPEHNPSTLAAFDPRLDAIHRELKISPNYASERNLSPHPEAELAELVDIGTNDEGRPIRLVQPAAHAWETLRQTALLDGITLVPISGFRSIARQTEIIREKIAAGQPMAEILRYIAAPGFSEHHTGRAIDIGSPEHIQLDEDFARTTAFSWLDRRASEFRFFLSYPRTNAHGIGYEPWHWCWHK